MATPDIDVRESTPTGLVAMLFVTYSMITIVGRHVAIPLLIFLPIVAPIAIAMNARLKPWVHRLCVVVFLAVAVAGVILMMRDAEESTFTLVSMIPAAIAFPYFLLLEFRMWRRTHSSRTF